MQLRRATEVEAHTQDQPAAGFTLEQAVAVSELAVLQRKLAQLAGFPVQRDQPGEHVLQFNAIGTNVLHGCSPHGTGNQAEVFQATQALLQRPEHQRMPRLAGFGLQQHILSVIRQNTHPSAGHAQDEGLYIARQQQVATTTDHQQRKVTLGRQGDCLTHLGIFMRLGEQPRLHVDAEGVVGLEG
ncbi:hypothetical protein FQZ97_735310 [compost metagenome]